MLKPQYDFEVDYIFLPFVRNVVDMTQAQQFIDADIAFALNGQWNTDLWGSKTDFWKYFITKYGHYRIMQQYTEEVNDMLICEPTDFNKGVYPVLIANHQKYDRLAKALKKDYDVLEPYAVDEEHSEGNKSSKSNMFYAQHTDTTSESSMDDTQHLYPASEVEYGQHTDYIERTHDQSTTFKDTTFESGSDETHHRKDYRHGNIGNQTQADLIEKEIELARFNFWDIVCKDILDAVCLKLFYTSC